jgi:hypothetical protein
VRAQDLHVPIGRGDLVEPAVVDDRALADQEDAAAEPLDVLHVVAREQHGGPVLPAVLEQEVAHGPLRHQVEPDRRFVQEHHARAVQQRGDQLHLHPLAEREPAHGHVQLVADREERGQLLQARTEGRLGDPVDVLVQQEAVRGGEVPPQLRLLAHQEGHLPAEVVVALPRAEAEHARVSGRGVDDPREHLHERGLAGAVRPHEADDLALLHAEGGRAHRLLRHVAPAHERLQGAAQPRLLLRDAERLGEAERLDHLARGPGPVHGAAQQPHSCVQATAIDALDGVRRADEDEATVALTTGRGGSGPSAPIPARRTCCAGTARGMVAGATCPP